MAKYKRNIDRTADRRTETQIERQIRRQKDRQKGTYIGLQIKKERYMNTWSITYTNTRTDNRKYFCHEKSSMGKKVEDVSYKRTIKINESPFSIFWHFPFRFHFSSFSPTFYFLIVYPLQRQNTSYFANTEALGNTAATSYKTKREREHRSQPTGDCGFSAFRQQIDTLGLNLCDLRSVDICKMRFALPGSARAPWRGRWRDNAETCDVTTSAVCGSWRGFVLSGADCFVDQFRDRPARGEGLRRRRRRIRNNKPTPGGRLNVDNRDKNILTTCINLETMSKTPLA